MGDSRRAAGKAAICAGLASLAAGGFIVLVASGAVPVQDARAPAWVIAASGGAFVVAGLILMIQAFGRASGSTGELPADAPGWMRTSQWLFSLVIWGLMAAIGSWVAFGPGPRSFSMSLGGLLGPGPDIVGRVAFGVGAAITWLGFAAVLAQGLKRRSRPAARSRAVASPAQGTP
jgi:hypothetical protein